jgi:predicted phosphodiesterase
MKINVLSDLHLNHEDLPHPVNDADVVVLAGDIARPQQAVEWAKGLGRPVIYVPGNHEFYGDSLDVRLRELQALCDGTSIRLLDCSQAIIGGVRFVGTTLWTDFALLGHGEVRDRALADAMRFLRDFSRIFVDDERTSPLTPERWLDMHRRQRNWLDLALNEPFDGPTVVVTHHAPSPSSIHPRFAGSPLNLCFISDLEPMMGGNRVQLWIHGHTHNSFDYRIDGTRVVCNPRGYAVDGMNENEWFDPDRMIEVSVTPGTPPDSATTDDGASRNRTAIAR